MACWLLAHMMSMFSWSMRGRNRLALLAASCRAAADPPLIWWWRAIDCVVANDAILVDAWVVRRLAEIFSCVPARANEREVRRGLVPRLFLFCADHPDSGYALQNDPREIKVKLRPSCRSASPAPVFPTLSVCGRDPWSWPRPSAQRRNSVRPWDSPPAGPIWRDIRPA